MKVEIAGTAVNGGRLSVSGTIADTASPRRYFADLYEYRFTKPNFEGLEFTRVSSSVEDALAYFRDLAKALA